jgi:subtilisin family serine protease
VNRRLASVGAPLVAVVAICVAGAALSPVSAAATGSTVTTGSKKADRLVRKDLHGLEATDQLRSDKRVSAMVQLEAAPAAVKYRAALGKGKAAARLAGRQAAATSTSQADQVQARFAKAAPSARTLYRTSRVLSGIAVNVKASELAALRGIDGVKSVQVMTPKKLMNTSSVPLIKAPASWALPGGAGSGQGVRIGIIDSGIDYTHADFGGPGTPAAYAAAHAASASPADPDFFGPGAPKVVGGKDFAGDAYDPSSQDPAVSTPQPDANPIDCDGHGTHVAGTAAGFGVDAAGQRYGTGVAADYSTADASPTFFNQFAGGVGPGVAPLASLYALKIFGCTGSTLLVPQALDWAMDPNGDDDLSDHLDVVNLSLGGDFGSPQDPDAQAANTAVLAGVTVVAAMGNSGDLTDVGSSPADATRAIAVAATDDTDHIADFSSRGRRTAGALKPDVSAPGVSIDSAAIGTGTESVQLDGTSMATPHVAGEAALVIAAHRDWSPEEVKAAIVNTAGIDVRKGSTVLGPVRAGAGRVDAAAAVATESLAYTTSDPGAVSVSFGTVAATDATVTLTKQVLVANKSAAPITYALSLANANPVPGVTYSTPPSLDVPAGDSASFTVTLTVNRAALRSIPEPTMATSVPFDGGAGTVQLPADFVTQAATVVRVTPAGGSALRVPVAATVRPASTITTTTNTTFPATASASATVTLGGSGVSNTTGAGPIQSRGQVFSLAATSPQLLVPFADASSGDLKSVGVTSNAEPVDESFNSISYVAINTYGPWTTPASYAVFNVYIDADRDGQDDHLLYNTRLPGSDLMVAVLVALDPDGSLSMLDFQPINGLHSNGTVWGFGGQNTAKFDSDTLTLPFFTDLLGGPTSRFDYWVLSGTAETGVMDFAGTPSSRLTMDAAAPAIRATQVGDTTFDSTYADLPGKTLQVVKNTAQYNYDRSLGELFVHYNNVDGARAEQLIIKQAQTIPLPASLKVNHLLSAGKFAVGATSTSGQPVSITASPSSICTVSGGYVVPVKLGVCTVTLNQAGNAHYFAAPAGGNRIAFQLAQSIPLPASLKVNHLFSAGKFPVGATATSGLPVTVTASPSSVCKVSAGYIVPVKVGICTVSLTQAGNTTYAAAPVSGNRIAFQLSQSIPLPASLKVNHKLSAGKFAVGAKATSGLHVTITASPSTICKVSGGYIVPVKKGVCTVTLTQAGNATYAAAKPTGNRIAFS